MLDKPAAGEASHVCAGESCLFSRGRIPEDPAKVRSGENTAGRDSIVLCALLFDGEAQVRDGLFELLRAVAVVKVVEEVTGYQLVHHPGISCTKSILVEAQGLAAVLLLDLPRT